MNRFMPGFMRRKLAKHKPIYLRDLIQVQCEGEFIALRLFGLLLIFFFKIHITDRLGKS